MIFKYDVNSHKYLYNQINLTKSKNFKIVLRHKIFDFFQSSFNMKRNICISSLIVCILLTGSTLSAKCPTDSSKWCKSIETAKDCNVSLYTKLTKNTLLRQFLFLKGRRSML